MQTNSDIRHLMRFCTRTVVLITWVWLAFGSSWPLLARTVPISGTERPTLTVGQAPKPNTVASKNYRPPCQEPQDHDRCDLEAQWNGVHAARDAADWGWWQMVFSAFGLAGLLYSLVLTRRATKLAIDATHDADKALEVASRNADAASRLAELSEQTARQQLRAYVSVEPCGVNEAANGIHRVPLLLHNSGETPAHKIMIFSKFALHQYPRDFDPKDSGQPLSAEINDASLGRGVQRHVFSYVREDFLSGHLGLIAQKE